MSSKKAASIISKGTIIEGELSSSDGAIEEHGEFKGRLKARDLVINESGKVAGNIEAVSIVTGGRLEGELAARRLLAINSTGNVSGEISYLEISMEEGGKLDATLNPIPAPMPGGRSLSLKKGKALRLQARDMGLANDNEARDMTFAISECKNGFVISLDEPKKPALTISMAELAAGKIVFVHDGKDGEQGSFVVRASGASANGLAKAHKVSIDILPE
jgi:cytoskeletal protein CcmA (bactofilin family)